METNYKPTQEELLKAKQTLTHLRNLSLVMKLLFNSPSQVMQDYKCTLDEACNKLDKAYTYTQKYGSMYIKNVLTDVKPIIDQLLYDAIKSTDKPTDNSSK